MKVREVLNVVNDIKPNAFSNTTLMNFLNEVESMAWTEVLGNDPTEYVPLSSPEDNDHELIVVKPYDKVYASYIQAMIDFQNEESTSYGNNMEMFNSTWSEYIKYMNRTNENKSPVKLKNYW